MGTLSFPLFSKTLVLEKPRIFSKEDIVTSGTLGHKQDSCQELLHGRGHGDIGISGGGSSHWGLPWGRDIGTMGHWGQGGLPSGVSPVQGMGTLRTLGETLDHSGGSNEGFLGEREGGGRWVGAETWGLWGSCQGLL